MFNRMRTTAVDSKSISERPSEERRRRSQQLNVRAAHSSRRLRLKSHCPQLSIRFSSYSFYQKSPEIALQASTPQCTSKFPTASGFERVSLRRSHPRFVLPCCVVGGPSLQPNTILSHVVSSIHATWPTDDSWCVSPT
mmetsp:Transcript_2466/g.9285  ORF Transcript_2466/g.9285 Transcript_2466/m.9285 type:complete len:138 (+) Transcript_2466:1831-2244(+)